MKNSSSRGVVRLTGLALGLLGLFAVALALISPKWFAVLALIFISMLVGEWIDTKRFNRQQVVKEESARRLSVASFTRFTFAIYGWVNLNVYGSDWFGGSDFSLGKGRWQHTFNIHIFAESLESAISAFKGDFFSYSYSCREREIIRNSSGKNPELASFSFNGIYKIDVDTVGFSIDEPLSVFYYNGSFIDSLVFRDGFVDDVTKDILSANPEDEDFDYSLLSFDDGCDNIGLYYQILKIQSVYKDVVGLIDDVSSIVDFSYRLGTFSITVTGYSFYSLYGALSKAMNDVHVESFLSYSVTVKFNSPLLDAFVNNHGHCGMNILDLFAFFSNFKYPLDQNAEERVINAISSALAEADIPMRKREKEYIAVFGENSAKSTIGHLIEESEYTDTLEWWHINDAIKKAEYPSLSGFNPHLLRVLEEIHDNYDKTEWVKQYIRVFDLLGYSELSKKLSEKFSD